MIWSDTKPFFDFSYVFSHAEFHWGTTSAHGGSEHSIDGHKSAMEVYLVHYRQKHGSSYTAAVKAAAAAVDGNGIAVIAFKIEVFFRDPD